MQVANVGNWLQLGGPVMLVLLIMSIWALTLILLKVWQFTERRVGARDYLPQFLTPLRVATGRSPIRCLTGAPVRCLRCCDWR